MDLQQVKTIFNAAAPLRGADRQAYLNDACGGDTELRREVEAYLDAADQTAGFLATEAGNRPTYEVDSAIITEQPGSRVGRYKLLQQIGEGGFGVVFMAEQEQPVRRNVALKIIKRGMDTRQVVARFEAERQALAIMDHPNIAKVFDAGSTDAGRPYFVMELVRGTPITEYCNVLKLGLTERLQLFIAVCNAVQHAHQKGIIHRDIKPSNVLVTLHDGTPMPKIIDFGIAKAISQRLTEKTLFTEFRQMIGTPAYMSPEQAGLSALDIDTRSDIYSLGVLLYELLTDSTPFDTRELLSKAFDEMQRIIREVNPPSPSTRLSTIETISSVAATRGIEPRKLRDTVRGELDWIVMRCLEKDRTHRYSTAVSLGMDIQRYLANEPVEASPPSQIYRFRKFVHRNMGRVIVAGALLLTLIAGVIGTSIGFVREARQRVIVQSQKDEAVRLRNTAEGKQKEAEAVVSFLTDDVLAGAAPDRMPDSKLRDQIIKSMLDPAAQKVGERFKDQPLVEAAVRNALHSTYVAVGHAQLALPHAEAALALRRKLLGEEHADTLTSLNNYAVVLNLLDRVAEAEQVCRKSYEMQMKVLGEDSPETVVALRNLCGILWRLGRFAEAESLLSARIERDKHAERLDNNRTIGLMGDYGKILRGLGRPEDAEPYLREALERERRTLGEDHPQLLISEMSYAHVLFDLEQFPKAGEVIKDVVTRQQRVLGPDHPDTLNSTITYATVLGHLDRLNEAEALIVDVIDRSRRVLGNDNPLTITAMNNYAGILRNQKKLAEAESAFRQTVELARSHYGADYPDTVADTNSLSIVLMQVGKAPEAESILRDILPRALANPSLGPQHPMTKRVVKNLASALDLQSRQAEAAELRKQYGISPPATTQATTQP